MASSAGWFRPVGQCASLTIRVVPNAGRNAIEGTLDLADGSSALKLRIAAPPEGGRANAAAIAVLAKATGLPRSAFSLKTGATARTKTILVSADAGALVQARERLEHCVLRRSRQ